MSRIGQKPVEIPKGVMFDIEGQTMTVSGPKGKLMRDLVPEITVELKEGQAFVVRKNETQRVKALHGLCRSLISNMVTGVSAGFSRILLINGVGYRAEVQDRVLTLNLGFSNPIEYPIPEGIEVEVEANTRMNVRGIDKEMVGQVCAELRGFRPPEPYKGKGVKYEEETIHRKVGKSGIK